MTEDLDDGRSLEFGHYVAVVRRRWYVVLACLLVGLLMSLAYLSTAPKSVTATTSVNVNVISSQPFDTSKPASQLFDPVTESQVAASSQVLGGAATELGNGQSLTQMRAHTVVQPVAGATIVKISYTAPTAAAAIKGADTIAKDYLDYRSASAVSKVDKVVTKLNNQRETLRKALVQANQRLVNAQRGSPQAVQADSDRQLIDVELTASVAQINALDSVDTSGGTLLSSASQNALAYSPNTKLVVGAGALLGLIVGLMLAFFVNALDRRIADGRALTGIGGGAVLSELRARHARVPATGSDLDQIRALRERLLASLPSGATLVVMDLVIRDRPSDVAVNLALSMVETGGPVRLVLPNHSDEHLALLTAVLELESVESSSDSRVFASRRASGLQVVVTQEDHELGTPGAHLGTIMTTGDEPLRTTIVSMPPTAPRSLWLIAGRLGHSIILVAARRETRVSAVHQVVRELDAVGAVIHGSVLVRRRRTVEMATAEGPPPPVVPSAVEETQPEPDQVEDEEREDDEVEDEGREDDEGSRDSDERAFDVPLDFDEQSSESEHAEVEMTTAPSGRT